MILYAFDIDHTLEIAGGPVSFRAITQLRRAGHITGLCGNWGLVTRSFLQWHELFSFLGPAVVSKEQFLLELKVYCRADAYVMVGNDPALYGASNDKLAAQRAGWRFMCEEEFASGAR